MDAKSQEPRKVRATRPKNGLKIAARKMDERNSVRRGRAMQPALGFG